MFKKTKIAAVSAAVLGLSGMAAQTTQAAVSINEAGSSGQVLVFPYYNVNNSYITTYNITNTQDAYKAIKIRFRESENSNDVLDFNLYMSPFDVFTMSLSSKDGGVVLKTSDNTCTHPTIPEDGVLFRHAAYASTNEADVREGYLEVVEMGEIDESVVIRALPGGAPYQSITSEGLLHGPDGMPFDCTVVERAWQQKVFIQGGARSNFNTATVTNEVFPDANGYPSQPTTSGYYGFTSHLGWLPGQDVREDDGHFTRVLNAPQGGLVGTSILVDLNHVTGFVAEPIAVQNYSSVAQHYLSSDENFYLLPSLASGAVKSPEYGFVRRDWGMDDQNVLPRTSVPSGINPMAISEALLVTNLGNQYFLGEGTHTDWVVTAPMRKHAIYNDYKYFLPGQFTGSVLPAEDIPVDMTLLEAENGTPEEKAVWANERGYWQYQATAKDVNAKFGYFDREEQFTQPNPGDFSPPIVTPDAAIPFPREVNILALNSGDASESVLGSDNAQGVTLAPGFNNGWGAFSFTSTTYNLAGTRYAQWNTPGDCTNNSSSFACMTHDGHTRGVPLFGFMAARSDLGPESVGETFPHFYMRD